MSMADKTLENIISLKALVDKGSSNVIFVESDNDFSDVLLSFLTIPMGTIVRRARKHSVPVEIGCMNNLYASVENIAVQYFQTEACREMLLCPHNGVESLVENLKLKIDNDEPTGYFLCDSWQCTFDNKLLSHYKGVRCHCGACMKVECRLSVSSSAKQQNGVVFVKELARLIITDDLHVLSPLSVASNPLFGTGKLGVGVMNTEQLTLNVGVDEVLNLLMRSLYQKEPLTETLLNHNSVPKFSDGNPIQSVCTESLMFGDIMNEDRSEEGKISVKLTSSKSRNIVCYAEAGEDFVNLLFSFLTVPLGFIVKHMRDVSFRGCIDQLYKSVEDLDEQYLKSNYYKEILLSPKLYPGFCHENHLLGIEDGPVPSYYYAYWNDAGLHDILTTDKSLIPANAVTLPLKLINNKNPQGYLKGSTVFTVTDKLIISPVSPIFGFSVLNGLKVPLTDIKEETILVGKKEALSLLVASFLGDSALTDVFIRQRTQEQIKSIKRG